MTETYTLGVFAYNFPHKKTQDFLLRLFMEGIPVRLIVAADLVKLDIPAPSIRTKIRHSALFHPRQVAERIGAEFAVAPHNSEEAIELVNRTGVDLAVISGARILKAPIISAVTKGIINLHPGLIPEARGLDAMLWSILRGIPLGVTAHLIDERIDAGKILLRREIPLKLDDTLFDLAERLIETQLEMLRLAIESAAACKGEALPSGTSYNEKMPPKLEEEVVRRLPAYLLSMSEQQHQGGGSA